MTWVGQLYFPLKEGVLQNLSLLKIHHPRLGFNV
jgi:hypothetical protein